MSTCNEVLDRIEPLLNGTDIPVPLQCDKYIASSVFQKAVRRGDADKAAAAALTLWRMDRRAYWRRCHITAMEDVGAYELDVILQVLFSTMFPAWRRRVGEERLVIYLARLLSRSVKTRLSDELFIQAERSLEYKELRGVLCNESDAELKERIANVDLPLVERALSAWFLSGTKKFPSDFLPSRNGSVAQTVEVLRRLDIPASLVDGCVGVIGRTSWPLSIFTPLCWQELRKTYTFHTLRTSIRDVPEVRGVPVYAADMFTRTGKAAYLQFRKAVPELRQFTVRQIGLAMFYMEGGIVDRLVLSDDLEKFRGHGEITDIEGVGLALPEYLGLREILSDKVWLLDEIRCKQLHQTLEFGDD